jgi:hypothetical protein
MINKDNVPDNEDVHKGAKRSSTSGIFKEDTDNYRKYL